VDRVSLRVLFAFRCLIVLAGVSVAPPYLGAQTNPVVAENENPGTTSWRITRPTDDINLQMKAYLSTTSASAGEMVDIFASVSPAQNYTLEVYRLGYYGGDGGRLLQTIPSIQGHNQPPCPVDAVTGQITCSWSSDLSLTIPSSWTTGIYLFKFTNAAGFEYQFPFAVRDDTRIPDIIYQQPVTTYQSTYNSRSYGADTISGDTRAVKVSFDRPYYGKGGYEYERFEHETILFLEEHGYDVGYLTNIDVHRNPSRLLQPEAVIAGGHDEYWTTEIYDAFTAARDAGVNLLFMGANAAYWQIRFEASAESIPNRVMVAYKNASTDPEPVYANKTLTFRKLGRAEQQLIGVQYITFGRPGSDREFVAQNTDHWVYEGSGLADGDVVPRLIGGEVDLFFAEYPPPVSTQYTVLGSSPFRGVLDEDILAQTVIYEAPSGALVFATGSLRWQRALAGDQRQPAVRQMMKNLFDRYVGGSADTGLHISKAASLDQRGAFPVVGDTISYAFDLVNSGDLIFSNLHVRDPMSGLSAIDCGNGFPNIDWLEPTRSVTCTATYALTQSDLNRGAVVNTATVSGASAVGRFSIQSNTVTTPFLASQVACGEPEIDPSSEAGLFVWQDCSSDLSWHIVATAGGSDSVAKYDGQIVSNVSVGALSTVSFESSDIAQIENTNTLNFVLRMLRSGIDGIDFSASGATSLCLHMNPSVVGSPVYLGAAKRVFSASEFDLLTGQDCNQQPLTALSLSKSGVLDRGADAKSTPGDIIDYLFLVTNEGTGVLNAIVVEDNLPGLSPVDCGASDADGDGAIDFLAPSMSAVCGAGYAITQQDIDTGFVINTATATTGNTTAHSQTVSTPIPDGSVQVSCGRPEFDSSTEAGMFIWQDCQTTGTWHIIATAGGASTVAAYGGSIQSNTSVSGLSGVSYESSDQLSSPDTSRISFLMRMLNRGQDGIDFDSAGSTLICLNLVQNSSDSSVFLGENKLEVVADNAINLFTGLTCDDAAGSAMTLLKTGTLQSNGNRDPEVGDVIVYEFLIANTGTVELRDIQLTDPLPGIGAIDCGASDLDTDGDVDALAVGDSA